MRIGIFADVHANEEALDAVIQALKSESPDQIICAGDLIGYGPSPNECVQKVIDIADFIVAGNHDYAGVEKWPIDHFNQYARESMAWTRSVLTSESKDILNALPLILDTGLVTIVHGSVDTPAAFNYVISEEDVIQNLMALTTPYCVIGHTHKPAIYIRTIAGMITMQKGKSIKLTDNCIHMINIGSVGQPRDTDARTAYGMIDTESKQFELKRLDYPVKTVQQKMKAAHLPDFLIKRLEVGQ